MFVWYLLQPKGRLLAIINGNLIWGASGLELPCYGFACHNSTQAINCYTKTSGAVCLLPEGIPLPPWPTAMWRSFKERNAEENVPA